MGSVENNSQDKQQKESTRGVFLNDWLSCIFTSFISDDIYYSDF